MCVSSLAHLYANTHFLSTLAEHTKSWIFLLNYLSASSSVSNNTTTVGTVDQNAESAGIAKLNESNDRLLRDIAHQAAALKAELQISLLKGSYLSINFALWSVCLLNWLLWTRYSLTFIQSFFLPLFLNIDLNNFPNRCENSWWSGPPCSPRSARQRVWESVTIRGLEVVAVTQSTWGWNV